MPEEAVEDNKKKAHRKRQAGKKFEKKKAKNQHVQEQTAQQRNPKAFSFQSVVKTQRKFIRTQDHKIKKHHTPVVDRTPLDPPPVIVAVVGGPKVGKSTLLRCLIKNYTKQRLTDINGPVTIIAGKNKKVTFIEINNDINCMIDVAKVADIVLVMIDATFGIEMEVFEFLEICRTHGSPRIMGVLNHLDMLKDNKALKKKKKILKRRFQVELYPGAKLFYLAGLVRGEYLKAQVKNLSRYINLMKFRPLAWRTSHPYILVDRYEDITNPESIRTNPKCDRDVVLYGYVRGVPLQNNQMVHIPGCGDFKLKDVSFLPDPCPFPEKFKKRSLNSKERLIYAPMSGVGGVVYDKDAVYIDLGSNRRNKKKKTVDEEDEEEEEEEDAEAVLEPLLTLQKTTDEKQAESQIQVFSKSQFINNANDKNTRNKHVKFEDEENEEYEQDEMDDEQDEKDDADENEDDDDEEEEEDEDEENMEMPKRGLPSFEVVEDGSGRVRRRAIFNDNLEEDYNDESDVDTDEEDDDDDDDDDDEEENGVYKDEEEESDDDNESDEEEEEVSPPKKRQKSHLSDMAKSGRIEAADSDSEEYDVDNDLKEIVGNLGQEKESGKCVKSGTTNSVGDSEKRKKTPKAVKINKDMEVTSKIQSILEKIKNDQNPKPRTKGYDSGFDNDTEEDEEASSLSESEESVPGEEIPKEEESSTEHEKEMKEEEEEEEEEDEDDNKMDYRTEMFKEATKGFYQNQSTVSYLRKYIYGDVQKEDEQEEEDEGEDIGGLFRLASKSKRVNSKLSGETNMNEVDSSRYIPPVLRNWTSNELVDSIRDCFMTGEWDESKNAETLLKMDDEDRDLYGDFEDLETGQKFTATTENEKEEKEEEEEEEEKDEAEIPKEEEKSRKEKYLEKKKRLKELFDAEYDNKDDDYFESLKEEMNQQAQLNRSEFEGLEDEVRVQYEGFRPGMYVRLEFNRFPCEFITNFDSSYPVIVGGLLENESNMGFVRVRVKAHRWYPRILKNRDPLILSLGWRRFQTLMYYAKREDNFVMRSLKYARKYLHVEGMFWGPLTTVNTGFVALQNISDRVPEFRIAANGVVLEADQSCKIVKKLKLLGVPEKVVKKTAFVKNMFHTETEVAKFVGAKIQTQSGIRGIIKKSLGDQGLFRATFEDSIRRSDVVILKTWVPIDLTRFCSTLRTLLLTPQKKAEWQGMKTVSQIKREKGIKNEVNPDHLYTPITQRREHIKRPLRIPRTLQKNLPYSMKPKIKPDIKKAQRVLVVKDPDEIKMDRFMGRLKLMMDEKIHKRKLEVKAQKEKYREQMSETNARREARDKRLKKAICRKISKKEGKQSKSFA